MVSAERAVSHSSRLSNAISGFWLYLFLALYAAWVEGEKALWDTYIMPHWNL